MTNTHAPVSRGWSLLLPRLLCLLLPLLACLPSRAQDPNRNTITGVVTDTAGKKIEGASVVVEGRSAAGTSTDVNGRFVVDAAAGTKITISFVGYIDYSFVVAANRKEYPVVLQLADQKGDEVIVVAYGKKQRKEAVVGSVTSVRPGELKIPASNLTTALAGQAAGVIAYQTSGQPGQDNATFFIRGVTTFGYKKDPLILIDNVEMSSNDLARLQVDDIASFSILKDANATALYGARGANGVILVSTKEGKVGKAKLNFRLENSFSQSNKTLDLADPITYMNLYNEASVTRGQTQALPFNPDKIRNTQATINNEPGNNPYVYPAVDWMDLLFKKRTSNQRANLSLSGGGGVARYYVAGSYNRDNGILREDTRNNADNNVKFENYQLRSNVNINLTRSTEMIVRLSGNFSEYGGPLTADGGFSMDLYNIAMHTSPVDFPAYYEPDSANRQTRHILFGNMPNTDGDNTRYNNPYALMLRGTKSSSESRMSAQVELNHKADWLTQGLNFHAMVSTNRYNYFESSLAYKPFYYSVAGYDRKTNQYSLNWINRNPGAAIEYLEYNRNPDNNRSNTFFALQTSADYNRKFGDHGISSSLIMTMQQTSYSNASSLFTSLPYRNMGVAGRLTYSLKDRYFGEFNFGYNGSERFSEEHRYGFFPTFGVSWVVSKEKFWQPLYEVVSNFKIRSSLGLVGNDAIGAQRFFYLSEVKLNEGGYAVFGTNNNYSRNGVSIVNYQNEDISWETSRQANIAVEMTVLKNINITAEFYQNHRYNILQARSYIPSTSGLEATMNANLGKAESKGIDLSVDMHRSFSRDFSASIRGNFTLATSKYTYIEEPKYKEPWRYWVGNPIGRAYGLVAERLFVDDVEARSSPVQAFSGEGSRPMGGDIKYRDLNGDGNIDVLDIAFMGYPEVPEIVYGFGFSSTYKRFDLSAFFQGQARVSFFINPERMSPFIPSPDAWVLGNTQVLQAFADDHWSEENQDLYALYPRLGTTRNQILNNIQQSSWWLRSAAFLRLKSLEVGYTLPDRVVNRLKIDNARFYLNGMNLLTWSSFKLWDPELRGNGFAYPIQRVFNIGVNVNF
ncbi:MAG: TonB-dependent receptor [Candidatus Pseudobacter hemicellulosilyticus]|uniref:TonB-dependent receptor n=1 Tax=Candidatus Pseudobacter hemicellulosilyticus TaxID=3121375 RepID=A0AAJ6BH97_9BACT|nr:MAG: TonB-dependent receptor [Pseudobacter sp.]